jgi:hypothetical protein
MKIVRREIRTERLKDTSGREKQMESKHHNAKESEKKTVRR